MGYVRHLYMRMVFGSLEKLVMIGFLVNLVADLRILCEVKNDSFLCRRAHTVAAFQHWSYRAASVFQDPILLFVRIHG